jgi:transcription antitermination factor NusG
MRDELEELTWVAVHTRRGQEYRAAANLCAWGIEAFLPVWPAGSRYGHSGPVFSGYLFARLRMGKHFHDVSFCRGVSYIVRSGDAPCVVQEEIIEAIRCRIASDVEDWPSDHYTKGDPIRVVTGPLKDLTGVFDRRVSGTKRVQILLKILGADTKVCVADATIAKQGSANVESQIGQAL